MNTQKEFQMNFEIAGIPKEFIVVQKEFTENIQKINRMYSKRLQNVFKKAFPEGLPKEFTADIQKELTTNIQKEFRRY